MVPCGALGRPSPSGAPPKAAAPPKARPRAASALAGGVDVHDEPLAGADLVVRVDAVPALELRHRDLELPRDAVDRISAAHRVEHAPSGVQALAAELPCAHLDDEPLALDER